MGEIFLISQEKGFLWCWLSTGLVHTKRVVCFFACLFILFVRGRRNFFLCFNLLTIGKTRLLLRWETNSQYDLKPFFFSFLPFRFPRFAMLIRSGSGPENILFLRCMTLSGTMASRLSTRTVLSLTCQVTWWACRD